MNKVCPFFFFLFSLIFNYFIIRRDGSEENIFSSKRERNIKTVIITFSILEYF